MIGRVVTEVSWEEIQEDLNGAEAEVFIYEKKSVPFDFDAKLVDVRDETASRAYIDSNKFNWSKIYLDKKTDNPPRFFAFTDVEYPTRMFVCVYGEFYTLDKSGSVDVRRRSPITHLFFSMDAQAGDDNAV